jgi:hypothetical protein
MPDRGNQYDEQIRIINRVKVYAEPVFPNSLPFLFVLGLLWRFHSGKIQERLRIASALGVVFLI